MPSCQAPSCLTIISTEVEKSPHSILLAVSDKKHMPNCQGLWRNDLHFLTALFYAAIFLQMTAGGSFSLSSQAELPVGIRRNGSVLYEDSESRDLPSLWGLPTTDCDFSMPRRFRGNDKKTRRAAVSIRSLSIKGGASAVWLSNYLKGTPSFFSQPLHTEAKAPPPFETYESGPQSSPAISNLPF